MDFPAKIRITFKGRIDPPYKKPSRILLYDKSGHDVTPLIKYSNLYDKFYYFDRDYNTVFTFQKLLDNIVQKQYQKFLGVIVQKQIKKKLKHVPILLVR